MNGRSGAAVIVLAVVVAIVYGLFRTEAAPTLAIETQRPAIGISSEIRGTARAERGRIRRVSLSLEQGGHSVELDRVEPVPPAGWRFWDSEPHEVGLRAEVSVESLPWLETGGALIRIAAWPSAGLLAEPQPAIVERRVSVRLRPPDLRLLSDPPRLRPGDAGMVVFLPGSHVVESGVMAGDTHFPSFPAPGWDDGVRFVLFGVPLDSTDAEQVRLYAVDDAGNRSERSLPDPFELRPKREDSIRVTDAFLERVVPAIVTATPDLAPSASEDLLEQYLVINRDVRAKNRAAFAEFGRRSEPAFLWRGSFLPLEQAIHTGVFAEQRVYRYEDQDVDHQVHLGVDFASVAHAPIRAPNSGKVIVAEFFGIYGNAVVIDHGFGLISCSAHLSRISVEAGQWVSRGQEIGRTGATGLAGGDHLHLGIFLQGTPVDPLQWIDETWVGGPLARALSLVIEPERKDAAPRAHAEP
jgi:murein DD-endopeptidase MepM/ murein hydrolase activator NlpD